MTLRGTLTFGDTVHLPGFGRVRILDVRRTAPHPIAPIGRTTAKIDLGAVGLYYRPGQGWYAGAVSRDVSDLPQLVALLNAMDVHLPVYTAADYANNVQTTFLDQGRTAAAEMADYAGRVASKVALDAAELKAQAAAAYVCGTAGVPATSDLYRTVYDATLSTLRV